MDVKSAFLQGDLHEEIYMEQPPGYAQDNSSHVCLLKKSVYGLKQYPRAWYAKMDSFLLDTCFSRCHSHPNVKSSLKKEISNVTLRTFALFSWSPSLANQRRNLSFPV